MSIHKLNMPKPVKITCTSGLMVDGPPLVGRDDREQRLYKYGLQTGELNLLYNDTQDPALLSQLHKRCVFERDAWLQMAEKNDQDEVYKLHCLAGAAKQCINIEPYLFQMGNDKEKLKVAEDQTNNLIARCTDKMQEQLKEALKLNRDVRNMLPSCACCGKFIPHKRHFCGKCNIALYCGVDCQKQHWKAVHRDQCGKPTVPICAACGKVPDTCMKCARCKQVAYCNKTCQTWHWKYEHKKQCQAEDV